MNTPIKLSAEDVKVFEDFLKDVDKKLPGFCSKIYPPRSFESAYCEMVTTIKRAVEYNS